MHEWRAEIALAGIALHILIAAIIAKDWPRTA